MKTQTRRLLNFCGFILALLSIGCGPTTERRLPEQLPNRMVAPEASVEESVSGEQTSATGESGGPSSDPFADVGAAMVEFRLAAEAMLLGMMPASQYLPLQQKWVGSRYPACNYFLITALCEAQYCEKAKPFYKAADFDLYFLRTGWIEMTLKELKALFRAKARFDAVFQKSGVTSSRPGHVMVAVGLDPESGQVTVAEGSLGTVTHHIETVTDRYLESWNGGFHIFVHRPQAE